MASDKDTPIYLTERFLVRDYHREFLQILCCVWTNTKHFAYGHTASNKNKKGDSLQCSNMLCIISYFHMV